MRLPSKPCPDQNSYIHKFGAVEILHTVVLRPRLAKSPHWCHPWFPWPFFDNCTENPLFICFTFAQARLTCSKPSKTKIDLISKDTSVHIIKFHGGNNSGLIQHGIGSCNGKRFSIKGFMADKHGINADLEEGAQLKAFTLLLSLHISPCPLVPCTRDITNLYSTRPPQNIFLAHTVNYLPQSPSDHYHYP